MVDLSASPDMVQEFHARTQDPRSVMLEWKPPRKPGVMRYRVSTENAESGLIPWQPRNKTLSKIVNSLMESTSTGVILGADIFNCN